MGKNKFEYDSLNRIYKIYQYYSRDSVSINFEKYFLVSKIEYQNDLLSEVKIYDGSNYLYPKEYNKFFFNAKGLLKKVESSVSSYFEIDFQYDSLDRLKTSTITNFYTSSSIPLIYKFRDSFVYDSVDRVKFKYTDFSDSRDYIDYIDTWNNWRRLEFHYNSQGLIQHFYDYYFIDTLYKLELLFKEDFIFDINENLDSVYLKQWVSDLNKFLDTSYQFSTYSYDLNLLRKKLTYSFPIILSSEILHGRINILLTDYSFMYSKNLPLKSIGYNTIEDKRNKSVEYSYFYSSKIDTCKIAKINNNSEDNELEISPNPASNIIYISSQSKIDNITIIDMTGRVVKTEVLKNKSTINIEDLEDGIYFYSIIDSENKLFKGKIQKKSN